MTLTEFLLARIAEDESVANAVDPFAPEFDDDYEGSHARELLWDSQPHGRKCGWKLGEGIASECTCNYPTRVLVECEAKRRIVEEVTAGIESDVRMGEPLSSMAATAAERALQWLALPYADHPDYQDNWKP